MRRLLNHTRLFTLAAVVLAGTSCGSGVIRQGSGPSYLVVDLLQASRGASSPGPLSGVLFSDVITNVTSPDPCSSASPCPTVFADTGQVVIGASRKDVTSPVAPTTNNDITITRYHVDYVRADGRNQQGVDVPFGFDGAVTGTVSVGSTVTLNFELVRTVAKEQTPLIQMKTSVIPLTAIANVTFYGRDQVGNDVSVMGSITVEFNNFGDQ